jgi:pilus assembly protein CpaF
MESMILMGGFSLPTKTIREMITGSVDIIVQAARLRDGSRKITHITEVVGMEEEVVTLQNILVYEILGQDERTGKIIGRHRSTGISRPRFWDRAEYYGEHHSLAEALATSEVADADGSIMGE